MKFIILCLVGLSFISCGTMQQMHTAQTLDKGETEKVYGVTYAHEIDNQDDSDEVYFGFAQYNSRHGLSENMDFGYRVNAGVLRVNHEYNPEYGDSNTGVLLPGFGIDLKKQFIDSKLLDVALDVGFDFSGTVSFSGGLMMSNKLLYTSIFTHTYLVPELFDDTGDHWEYDFAATIGHKGKKYIFELRLPIPRKNTDSVVKFPVFSIGLVK